MIKKTLADGTIETLSPALTDDSAGLGYDPRLLAPLNERVNEKRAEIIKEGTTVTIPGYGDVGLQGRPEDQSSLQGLAFAAQLQLSTGTTTPITFLDRENVIHQLTPMQMITLWQLGAQFISAVYQRSWEIKEMDLFTNIDDPALWSLT